ncbi:Foldase protein prsA 1 precursor [uncultured Butyricicoccus sp.]|uniref:Peptidylprolyl isomerase n=1 Tax=Agathobaculum ammoniilyticum TaxID=2981778 RepID=A0ABT2U6H8_9FIRM|nr:MULTISPECIES: peptidylprolyl isomerase [Butyricicoccaceae]MBS6883068.1 peptidylprolyl isomerase [Clostridiaceae bacterium]MCU6789846.1 peptidylprolyl isomerase [Agathobaculum ammoniilyticum]WOC75715.1 peptidylprolyl isomerase [Intestinibacillus sp. NTUH-41-i26]SCJ39831.1 Foldase protein prsA 1 precursor [uncultured Butyricicoccus sp.]
MNKWVQRIAALVVLLAIVLGITYWQGSKVSVSYQPMGEDSPVVMTVNGDEVRAEEFATYMIYNMKYYENMYSQYGMMGLWSDDSSAEMLGVMMPGFAKDQAVYSRVVLEQFEKAGLELSYSNQKELSTLRKDTIDQAGGYDGYLQKIAQLGFNDQTYMNFLYITQCYSALNEYYYGSDGIDKPTDEELMEHFRDNYISAKHILILTVDPSTGETLRTDEEARALAQSILDRINAGEDFDALMNEYSEDGGLEGNPDGYIFTEGDMVTPFYEGAKALAEGEVSDLVKSDYGYHIIQRTALDYENQFINYQADLATQMGRTMDALLSQWMTEAEVETTDVYDEINYKNVYDYAPAGVAEILNGSDSDDSAASDEAAAE